MKVAFLTTDNRGPLNRHEQAQPEFGPAPEAIISALAPIPEIELHIISCIRRPALAPEKLGKNIWFHSIVVPKIGWMRTLYWGCVRAVRRKIREINPDIVHGQGTEHENGISAALSGYPNVITLHGIMQEQARLLGARPGSFYWLAHRLENFTLKRTAGVFCNSQYTEDSVRSRARNTWRVSNPLREAFFRQPIKSNTPAECILVNIGLVCPRKRQNELLQAAGELHAEGLKFQLHFIGMAPKETPYGEQFLKLIDQNRAFAFYDGLKSLGELIDCLDTSSALIHVPSEESFGLVVAEALARNLKVIGFQVGGLNDITKGVDGAELVRDADWEGLKSVLRKWIGQGFPKPLAAAKTMSERYHPMVIGRQHLEIYHEALRDWQSR